MRGFNALVFLGSAAVGLYWSSFKFLTGMYVQLSGWEVALDVAVFVVSAVQAMATVASLVVARPWVHWILLLTNLFLGLFFAAALVASRDRWAVPEGLPYLSPLLGLVAAVLDRRRAPGRYRPGPA